MALPAEFRGKLEQLIDAEIGRTKMYVMLARKRKELRIKEERDFVFGFLYGIMLGQFEMLFITQYRREPTDEELEEVRDLIERRFPEMDSAIFKAG